MQPQRISPGDWIDTVSKKKVRTSQVDRVRGDVSAQVRVAIAVAVVVKPRLLILASKCLLADSEDLGCCLDRQKLGPVEALSAPKRTLVNLDHLGKIARVPVTASITAPTDELSPAPARIAAL